LFSLFFFSFVPLIHFYFLSFLHFKLFLSPSCIHMPTFLRVPSFYIGRPSFIHSFTILSQETGGRLVALGHARKPGCESTPLSLAAAPSPSPPPYHPSPIQELVGLSKFKQRCTVCFLVVLLFPILSTLFSVSVQQPTAKPYVDYRGATRSFGGCVRVNVRVRAPSCSYGAPQPQPIQHCSSPSTANGSWNSRGGSLLIRHGYRACAGDVLQVYYGLLYRTAYCIILYHIPTRYY
jgi:hypothetical protein